MDPYMRAHQELRAVARAVLDQDAALALAVVAGSVGRGQQLARIFRADDGDVAALHLVAGVAQPLQGGAAHVADPQRARVDDDDLVAGLVEVGERDCHAAMRISIASVSLAGTAALKRKPCISSQPLARRNSSWDSVSTPSATTVRPRLCPRLMMASVIA